MIIVSYYTEGFYEKVMNKYLLPSLEKFNLQYDIRKISDLKDWNANTAYKAQFMKEMLLKHKQAVCFIDADGRIEQYPELLFEIPKESTLAATQLDWKRFWRGQEGGDNFHLLSGTMLFNYNDKALELCDKYIKECQDNPSQWEQRTLQKIIENDESINWFKLPQNYTAIVKKDGTIPEYVGEPVISHHQVSRIVKGQIKKEI